MAEPGEWPPQPGLHLAEWSCELLGTALLLLGGLSAVCLDFGPHSPLRGLASSFRLLLTGLLFAGTGSLLAISPLGRRSGAHLNPVVTLAFWTQRKVHPHDLAGYVGAHLNPVVTLAFWTQRKVHPHDLAGYVGAQLLGAVLGTAAVAGLWGGEARAVHLGATAPGRGRTGPAAMLVEAAMTAVLVLVLLLMTSSARTARWTALVLWPVIAGLVWQGAPYTGTSLNPARSLGPALLAPLLGPYWVYVAGPLLGGALAVAGFALLRDRQVLTAKLFHDPRYRSTLGTSLAQWAAAADRVGSEARVR